MAFPLAEAAEAVEHSKTAFYAAGGLLAGWAVVLSAVGLTRPDFPGEGGLGRGVIALTLLLVAAVMAATIVTS